MYTVMQLKGEDCSTTYSCFCIVNLVKKLRDVSFEKVVFDKFAHIYWDTPTGPLEILSLMQFHNSSAVVDTSYFLSNFLFYVQSVKNLFIFRLF